MVNIWKEIELLTPNMHLHCHIKETIVDYGPVYSTWCFTFERFNGILQSFQKNWIHPELQLLSKFLNFQGVLAAEFPFRLPLDVSDILQLHSGKLRELTIGQGSLQTFRVAGKSCVFEKFLV